MKVLICDEPGRLRLTERPEPVPAEGEALVRIRRVGICGTDFHIYQGKHPFLQYPRVMGHELSGTIERAPAGSSLEAGQNCYVVPYLSCGHCVACRKGVTNACQTISVLGVHCDGGMAELISVPARNVVPVGDTPLDDAAMIEFLAIGAHGVKRGGITAEDRVLVVGSGPIGMSAVIFAKAEAEAKAGAATSGDFYDCVIDCTGNRAAMQRGFGFVGHGGRYVLVSVVRDDIVFSDPEFHKRETTLFASRNAQPDDFAEVVRQMQAGRVPTQALRTHRGALADGPELFRDWLRPEAGVIKAILEL